MTKVVITNENDTSLVSLGTSLVSSVVERFHIDFLFVVELSILEIIGTESFVGLLLWQLKHYLDPVVKWPLNQDIKYIRHCKSYHDICSVVSELID